MYQVYMASYITDKKVQRSYVGYCYCTDVREWWMRRKPPNWMKCRAKDSQIRFDILDKDIPTKELARASEALFAARSYPHSSGSSVFWVMVLWIAWKL